MIATAPDPACLSRERFQAPGRVLRVLHVLPSLQPGGMETAFLRYLRAWTNQPPPGDEHGLVILGPADPSLQPACESIPVWPLGVRGRSCRAAWRLRRIIRAFAPDIVHARTTATWVDAAFAARGLPGVRLLVGFHGREHLREPSWPRRAALGWALRCAAGAITLSYDSADWLRRTFHVPAARLTVIRNGVDVEHFRPLHSDEARPMCGGLLAAKERLLVLCVANLVPIKAIEVLLAAWRRVRMIVPDARLAIAGEGPERAQLADVCQRLRIATSVSLLGRRTDVPQLLRAADLFVLPSRYECCSNALLEAMAAGLACIATTGGGSPELIAAHRTGWLVPPDDPPALAEAMISGLLSADARRRVGRAAREYVVQEHQLTDVARRYRECYLRTAGDSSERD